MKIKYSLVALFALSNISFVNAQSLENAIKNVETSGTVAYRYNDYEESTSSTDIADKGSDSTNLYKIALNLKSKCRIGILPNWLAKSGIGPDNTFAIAFLIGLVDNMLTPYFHSDCLSWCEMLEIA